jgi:thioredoxin reductase (NADPH)
MPGFPRLKESYDIVVVGGGHAGLQAALKTALLGYHGALIDQGPKFGRSFYAPVMDNIPGFPNGISGHALLDLQVTAVRKVDEWVSYFSPATARTVERTEAGYDVPFDWLKQDLTARARAVVLAMGVVDRMLEVGGEIKPIFPWANQALVDFCIFCDGHTLGAKSIAVLGHDAFAAQTALDLLHFHPASIEILTHGQRLLAGDPPEKAAELRASLKERGITSFESEVVGFDEIREKRFGVKFADGSHRSYEKGFSALGWYELHQKIPRSLGCRFDAEGYVVTDEDCRAISDGTGEPIPGLYCIGDQRNGWNQIPEAWATAERAVIHAYAEYL